MATLVIGAGLVGSQVVRLLVEDGREPVLLDTAHQRDALGEIVDHGSDLATSRAEHGYAPRFGINEAVADMVARYRSNERARRG